ncbi:hypothetical protein [Dyadobacter tibetensis]|uniref:hypothetical protein n=1 Tax=Dyadobacter tibetensis TaxID=1211851 RepID=UPI0004706483|nr:hypothetical protein [Dyadobacter tibetensis]
MTKLPNRFGEWVPEAAADYCFKLFVAQPVLLAVTKPRDSKLGDFTAKSNGELRVSVNGNLNPFAFLITYLHEMAHLQVHLERKALRGPRVAPHGQVWKSTFRKLLAPVANSEIFPADILEALLDYMRDPKARTSAHIPLYTTLKRYDPPSEGYKNKIALLDLREGSSFVFRNRTYVRQTARRTRVLCLDKLTEKLYTIPAHVFVEPENY